jgi:acylphosphatase
MSDKAVRIQVFGRVQGVGFRYFTRQRAMALGLHGRASNLADGSVEVFAVGESSDVEQLIQWLQQGPPSAAVERILVNRLDALPQGVPSDEFRAY